MLPESDCKNQLQSVIISAPATALLNGIYEKINYGIIRTFYANKQQKCTTQITQTDEGVRFSIKKQIKAERYL